MFAMIEDICKNIQEEYGIICFNAHKMRMTYVLKIATDNCRKYDLHALQFEYALNKDFVAGARKDELEALIPFLEKHRDELEEQRNKLAEG